MYDNNQSAEVPSDITGCINKGTAIHAVAFYGQRQNVLERVAPLQYGDTKLLMRREHDDCLKNCTYKAFVAIDDLKAGDTYCSNPAVVAAYMEKHNIVLPTPPPMTARQDITVQPTPFITDSLRYKPNGLEAITERALGIFRNYVATPISRIVKN